MRATIERAVRLDSVADDLALAVLAHRRELVNGALEAVEGMGLSRRDDLERQIVVVAADLALGHGAPPEGERRRAARTPTVCNGNAGRQPWMGTTRYFPSASAPASDPSTTPSAPNKVAPVR